VALTSDCQVLPGLQGEFGWRRGAGTLVLVFDHTTDSQAFRFRERGVIGSRETVGLSMLGIGARFEGLPTANRARPYGEVLSGEASASSKMEFSSPDGSVEMFDDGPGASLMAGVAGGLLVHLAGRVDLSTRGDYRYLFNPFGSANYVSASVGLRYRFTQAAARRRWLPPSSRRQGRSARASVGRLAPRTGARLLG
jgi:hypothetical protein